MAAISRHSLDDVTRWFEANFQTRGELGASVSIWKDGHEILSLADGHCDRGQTRAWTADTLAPVWSATKGPAAVCCLMALDEAGLPLDCPVAEVWPEFAGGGKHDVTFAQVLSHTAGLCALDERVPIEDHQTVIAALERQRPLWEPGTRQGYHARTFGFLADEIVRRVTREVSLGEFFRETLGSPLGLDFWIGLPHAQWDRVATVFPGRLTAAMSASPFLKAFNTPGSLTQRTFASPAGLNAVSDFNRPEVWAGGYASMGGVGSASGLGKFYALLAQGGRWHGRQLLVENIVAQLSHTLSQQEDSVLCTPVAFAAGVMQDPVGRADDGGTGAEPAAEPAAAKLRRHFGPSLRAFGHPGAGGCLGFADPENGIAFAYVMNQMEVGALPGDKVLGMVERLYA